MFGSNPQKLEEKAVAAERKGKIAKANKYRAKAARLTNQGHMVLPSTTTGLYGPNNAMLNQNGAYTASPMNSGMNNGAMMNNGTMMNNGAMINNGAVMNNGGMMMNNGLNNGVVYQQQQQQGFYTNRTPAIYEQNAVKWETRNNYAKAQKNRGKVWRLQNPQYAQAQSVPTFYQGNQFLGYNVPYQQERQVVQQQVVQQQVAVESIVRPTIVEHTTRADRVVEIQPIIHRNIDAPQVRVIEQHIYETVPQTGPSTITRQAIVEETVRPRIIEEIQPVVHRETPQTFVERVEQHVTEHVVRPATQTKEVQNQQPIGFGVAGAQGLVGAPVGTSSTTTTTTRY